MPATWDGVNIYKLNSFMKNYPTGKIVPEAFHWSTLYDSLKANIVKDGFRGDMAEILIQTSQPYTGRAFGEGIDIPYPGGISFVKQYIPLREVIVNAGISKQAMDRVVGGDSSWGRVVDAVLQAQRTDFLWLMELCAIGDGTGRLARMSSKVDNQSGKVSTLTCNNTYANFGWENTHLIKKGMYVEIYKSDGSKCTDGSGSSEFQVVAVTPGNRNNGAATDGTVVISYSGSWGTEPTANSIIYIAGTRSANLNPSGSMRDTPQDLPDGGIVYRQKLTTSPDRYAYSTLPMGLTGIVQSTTSGRTYNDGVSDYTWEKFQGLTRSAYPTLQSAIYNASDFGGTAGIPTDWDLSIISDAMNQINRDTGYETDLLICSSELSLAINRRNRAENNFTVQVGSTNDQNQNVVGAQFASKFLTPDGRIIPILVSKTIPRNVLYGLCTKVLTWYALGDFDFLRINGDIWDKSYNDRKANYEAPFGGKSQLGASRCDCHFVIQDMRDDI